MPKDVPFTEGMQQIKQRLQKVSEEIAQLSRLSTEELLLSWRSLSVPQPQKALIGRLISERIERIQRLLHQYPDLIPVVEQVIYAVDSLLQRTLPDHTPKDAPAPQQTDQEQNGDTTS